MGFSIKNWEQQRVYALLITRSTPPITCVNAIGSRSFSQCSSLITVIIPESVTSIEYYAFESCSKLTTIIIRKSVTYIGYCAFEYCSSLKNLFFCGTKEPEYGYDVFNGCDSLTTIYVPTTYTDDDETKFCDWPVTINKSLNPT